jgi:hypothetical protein
VMLADYPAAAGFARPQLTCAYQLMDGLSSDPERCSCLINAIGKSFWLDLTRTVCRRSDRS